ncbi:MAG TPA: hypothetical protein VK603_09265 [Candidatus Saccharimonadales bacterium]|nr:hypothetical protein [Candidatus Saccharimonadales bacterium]
MARRTYVGWTVGAGIEYGLSQNWLIKSEYQFVRLGEKSISAVASDGVTDTMTSSPSVTHLTPDEELLCQNSPLPHT